MRITYQVANWDAHFENNKSREREECSFVCVPNKQHGMGFSRVMAEKDGAAIYGIWGLIIGACSQQRKPRNGWLTSDGHQTGTAWAPEDLALKFRRPEAEIERAMVFLSSAKVGWLLAHKIDENPLLFDELGNGAHQVPAECPFSALEEKEEKERIYKGFRLRIGGWFGRRPTTKWDEKEEKALRKVIALETPEDEICLLENYYNAELPDGKDWRRREIETLLNNWNGEIDRARDFAEESQAQKGPNI